jgi:hypothetical protein
MKGGATMNMLWIIFIALLSAGIVAVSLRLRDPRDRGESNPVSRLW